MSSVEKERDPNVTPLPSEAAFLTFGKGLLVDVCLLPTLGGCCFFCCDWVLYITCAVVERGFPFADDFILLEGFLSPFRSGVLGGARCCWGEKEEERDMDLAKEEEESC